MADEPLAGSNAYLAGKPCPKCAYVRRPQDRNPDWQCARCSIAYLKYHAPAPNLASRLAAGGRDLAVEAKSDGSVHVLVAANAAALAIAWATKMSLTDLMLVYWIQSVIIGLTHALRVASLHDYSNDEPDWDALPWYAQLLKPRESSATVTLFTPEGKMGTAAFFLFHYGFFHFVYLQFIQGDLQDQGGAPNTTGLALCALVFAANHLYSLVRNIRNDRRGCPNLGVLMVLPYFRILPMHLTIMLGSNFFSAGAIILFAALKTLADVAMHTMEHHVLRQGRMLPPGSADG